MSPLRRIALWVVGTLSVLVLLFSHHTSTSGAAGVAAAPAVVGGPSGSLASSGSTGVSVTGDVVQTRWGAIQVGITVEAGTITAVTVPRYPTGNGKDEEINARALPILVSETLEAQDASIDMVSGATVTSAGYRESLQSALDEAGL